MTLTNAEALTKYQEMFPDNTTPESSWQSAYASTLEKFTKPLAKLPGVKLLFSTSKKGAEVLGDIATEINTIGGFLDKKLGTEVKAEWLDKLPTFLNEAAKEFDRRGLPSNTATERFFKTVYEGASAMPFEIARISATPGGIITLATAGRLSETMADPNASTEDITKAAGRGFAEGVLFHNAIKLAGVAGTEISKKLGKTFMGKHPIASELISRIPGGAVFAGPSIAQQAGLPAEQQDWSQPIADIFTGIAMAGKSGQTWEQYKVQMKKATVLQKLGVVAPGFEGPGKKPITDPEELAKKYGVVYRQTANGMHMFDEPTSKSSFGVPVDAPLEPAFQLAHTGMLKRWAASTKPEESEPAKARLEQLKTGQFGPPTTPSTKSTTGKPETKLSQFRANTMERSPFLQEVVGELAPEKYAYETEKVPEWQATAEKNIRSIGGEERIEKELLEGTTVDTKGGVQTHEEALLLHQRTQRALSSGKTGDYDNLLKLSQAAAQKHREQARGMTAIRYAYENMGTQTPEGMLVKTQKLMDHAQQKLFDEVPGLEQSIKTETPRIQKEFRDANKEASNVFKGDLGLKDLSGKLKEMDPATVLAHKIITEVQPKNAKEADLIKQMIGELFRVAKESPLERGFRPPAKSPLAKIADAIKGNAEYQTVWDKAKEAVKGTFKDDPEMVKLLDAYFTNPPEKPFSNATLDLALRQGMQKLDISLGDIARTYFQSGISKTVELRDYLITHSGLSGHDAELLAKYIDKRMGELTNKRKMEIVNSLFSDRKNVKTPKTAIEKINEMINLGVYTGEGVTQIVRLKGGLPMLTASDAKFVVETMAKVEGKDAYSPEKVAAIKAIENRIYQSIPRTTKSIARNVFNQVFSIPKTLMSGFADFSFGLRQGWFFLSKPKQWIPAFTAQFRAFASDNNYYDIMRQISKYKHYEYMLGKGGTKERLALSALDETLQLREERFQSQWVEKIPGIGKVVRATSRAFHGMANKLRADLYEDYWNKFEAMKLDPANNQRLRESMAQLINNGTGRGSLGKMESIAAELNTVAFAPRLFMSRIRILGPASFSFYGNLDPAVRREALKTLFMTSAAVATTVALAKLGLQAAGAPATVETDPISADFGKLRIGNTRIDLGGSNLPTIRLAAQLITGKVKSSETGKVTKLGAKYGAPTRWDLIGRFVEYKEAPVASFVTELLKSKSVDLKLSGTGRGKDYRRMHLGKELAERIAPMMIQDIYQVARENPGLLPMVVPAMFGAGLQTYGKTKRGGVGLQMPTSGKLSIEDAAARYRAMGYR